MAYGTPFELSRICGCDPVTRSVSLPRQHRVFPEYVFDTPDEEIKTVVPKVHLGHGSGDAVIGEDVDLDTGEEVFLSRLRGLNPDG